MKTSQGQCLDLHSCHEKGRPNIAKFTMERYEAIVKYKTGFYSFYLPVALAMYMVSIYMYLYCFYYGHIENYLPRLFFAFGQEDSSVSLNSIVTICSNI